MFFEKHEKPTKKYETRELGKDRWYSQMGQVGTGGVCGIGGTGTGGSSD